jgi:ribosomal protein L40E
MRSITAGLFKRKNPKDGTSSNPTSPASPGDAEGEDLSPNGNSSSSKAGPPGEEDKDLSLQVYVKQASGIAMADKGGFYCYCEEEPKDYDYKDLIKKHPSFQTPVKRIKKDPVWDFNSTFAGFDLGDKLKFQVRSLISEDITQAPSEKDAIVGEVTLDTGSRLDGFTGELDLKQDGKTVGTLAVQVTPCRRYEVNMVSATGLRNADWTGKSDPYCICEVLGRPDTRVETPVCKGSTNPEWNKTCEVDVARKDSLVFTLKDRDWPTGDDPLGSATLTGEQILKGLDDEIEIDDPSQKRGSTAKLKIVIKRISSAEHADAEAKKAAAVKIQAISKGRAVRKAKDEQENKTGDKKDEDNKQATKMKGRWKSEVAPQDEDKADAKEKTSKDAKLTTQESHGYLVDDDDRKKPRTTGLQVTLISAEGLKETDGKKPMPVCVCSLTGSEKEFFRTKGLPAATTDPKWDFQGSISEIHPKDSLDFTLKDAAAHDHLLGKATLEASKFNPMGFNGELILAFSGKGKKAKIHLKVRLVQPSSVVATPVKKPKPTGPWCFMLKLKSAYCERIERKEDKPKKRVFQKKLDKTDLRDKSAAELANEANQENPWMGMDTYAICQVPDKDDTMVVTRVIMNAFAPEWEEQYMIRNWKEGDDLQLSVWDYEPAPAKDQLLGKVMLKANVFEQGGFEGILELEEDDEEEGQEKKFRSLLNIQIYMLEASPEKQVKLVEQSRESYIDHIELKDPNKNKVRIAPGEVLRPKIKSVFQRLYQDHSDRAQKKRAAKEVFWESQQNILDALIESTCRTAKSKEIKEISKRLFEDGEIRRKKREEWIAKRHEQVISELQNVPEISAFASSREEGDSGGQRYEFLYAAAQRAEEHKEKLRVQQKEKEKTYLIENSVHANAEPQGEDDEVFERLFGESFQRKERFQDRLRDAKITEEEALFGRVVIDDPVIFNQIVDESSERLHGEHAKRLQRIGERKAKLEQIEEFQAGQIHQKKPGVKTTGSRTRFHMLYVDSLRRMEQQRLVQEKHERDTEQEIKDMQIFKSPPPVFEDTPANDDLDRIFGQLYNPEIRGKLTLGENPGAKASDSDDSDRERNKSKTRKKPRKDSTDDDSTPRKNKSSKSPRRRGDDSGSDDDAKRKSGRGKEEKSKQKSGKHADDKRQKPSSKSREDSTDSKRKKDDKSKSKSKSKGPTDSDSDDGKTSKHKSKLKSHDRGRGDSDSEDGKASKQKSRTSKNHSKSRGRGDSDSDESVKSNKSSRSKGKAAVSTPKVRKSDAPSSARKAQAPGTKSDASRAKTPPPRPAERGATGKGPAAARSRSTPAGKDSRSKTPPGPDQLGSRTSVTNLTPEQKQKKLARRQKAENMLRQQEVDDYTLQGWHPAYRHSLLLRVDPAHRAKVEADLDFREMMSRVPIQNREFCKKCQALFSPDAAFCRRCGAKREGGPEPAQPQVHPLVKMAEALKKKKARAADHFGKFDTNGNGRIAVKEFRQGIEELGLPMYYEDLRKLMVEVDANGNADGCVTIQEIEQALRKAEKMATRRKSELFQNATSSGPRRGTIAVAANDTIEGTAESLMSEQPARAITPSRTTKRRSVTGSPSDSRKSLLRHIDEDELIRDEQLLIPRTTTVRGDMRPSLLPPEIAEVLPPGTKWDTRPLRQRSGISSGAEDEDAKDGDAKSSPALDDGAIAALDKDVERELLLALEENIISGLNDSSINRIEPTPIPKALQGLVQNLGDYYFLKVEVEDNDDETVKMTLYKTEDSRLRSAPLSKMWKDREDQTKMGGGNSKPTTPRSKDGAKRPSGASKQSGGDGKTATTPRSSNSKDKDKKTPRSNNSKDKEAANEN